MRFLLMGWRGSGLLSPDLNPELAYAAFSFGRKELLGASFEQEITSYPGVKGYEFRREDHRVWILWSLDGNDHTIPLPSEPLDAWNVYGNPAPASQTETVGTSPLYFEW